MDFTIPQHKYFLLQYTYNKEQYEEINECISLFNDYSILFTITMRNDSYIIHAVYDLVYTDEEDLYDTYRVCNGLLASLPEFKYRSYDTYPDEIEPF